MTADDVLLVLDGLEPVELEELRFCVITQGAVEDYIQGKLVRLDEPKFWPFENAEILVVNKHGREPFGGGRKPSKWDVRYAEFDTLAEAVSCREEVLQGTWKDQS